MTPTDTFEDRLLDALLDRFDNLSYQPAATVAPARSRRSGVPRYAAPLAGLAIGATAATLALVETGGPAAAKHVGTAQKVPPAASSYALAAWTARPTAADPSQISTAEAHCLPSTGPTGAAPSDKAGPALAGGPWSPVIVDTRGDLTLAVYSDGTSSLACLTSPTFVWLNPVGAIGGSPVTDNTAILDEVTTRGSAGDLYTIVVGRTGSAVTGVGLRRTDGPEVTATVRDDRFVAWWPEGEGVTALSVTTASGTQDYPVAPRFAQSGPQPANRTVHSLHG